MGGDFRPNDGDWTCPDPQCANINFARRLACNRCGLEKKIERNKKQGTEIGSAAAEKSKGLFAADDWQCSKCGNVNWARRSTCNVCNAPKFTEVEERTGLGGGFDERGVVEYKERRDSDDEFDDFGRRKKKKGQQPVATVQQDPSDHEDEEDDDEEEDDDDGDLSKYDIWGNDDVDDKKNDEVKEVKSVSVKETKSINSRSRSRSKSRNRKKSRSRSRSRNKKRSRRSRR